MVTPATASIYEQPSLREIGGETIRPGGLALTDEALALCALPPRARVLDVGCGAGATVAHLRTRHHLVAFGLDLSALLLRLHWQGNVAVPRLQAAGERLPIGSGQLDAILAECSLSAMADVDRVLEEFERVLKADGILIVSDVYARNPDGLSALRPRPPGACLSGLWSQTQIAARLQTHGFQLTLWQDRSAALKQLAVQLIMTHGSLQQFWQQTMAADAVPEVQRAMVVARPGYYLLLARKGEA